MTAMEEPEQVGVPSQLPSAHAVEYASPVRKPPHSAWSVVGFALAILCAVPPGMMFWIIASRHYQSWAPANNSIHFHYVVVAMPVNTVLIPIWPISICLIGLRRGRKSLAIAGIVIATAALIGMIILAVAPWW